MKLFARSMPPQMQESSHQAVKVPMRTQTSLATARRALMSLSSSCESKKRKAVAESAGT